MLQDRLIAHDHVYRRSKGGKSTTLEDLSVEWPSLRLGQTLPSSSQSEEDT